jgi:uncharacterized protein (TIGR02145 family)
MKLHISIVLLSLNIWACNSNVNKENNSSDKNQNSEVQTVKNPKTGRIWMDRNLGATQVATSSTDSLSFGDLYQWGRINDGHEIRTSDVTRDSSITDNPGHAKFIIGNYNGDWRNEPNDKLWSSLNLNNVCPTGFHIPSRDEWEKEIETWDTPNFKGAYNSILKLPLAGMRGTKAVGDNNNEFYSSEIVGTGKLGVYWSGESTYRTSFSLYIGEQFNLIDGGGERWSGRSIRCIKDLNNNN